MQTPRSYRKWVGSNHSPSNSTYNFVPKNHAIINNKIIIKPLAISDNVVISTHIPKTGGTTLKNILQELYNNTFVWIQTSPSLQNAASILSQISQTRINMINCIHGHIPYGLHYYFTRIDSYRYITFLRSPDELLLSYHNFIFTDGPMHQYKWDINKNWQKTIDFSTWIRDCKIASQDNGMTRILSGMDNINTHDIKRKVTEDDFEKAKKHLYTYSFIGLTETLDFDLISLSNLLKWNKIPQKPRAWSYPNRKHSIDLNSSDVKYLYETQKYDFELYEVAKQINKDISKNI